jgi:hypothetical protein
MGDGVSKDLTYMAFVPQVKEREGRCYELAWQHIAYQDEGTLVHGEVWSQNLRRMIGHAWVVTETGWVYEPVADEYFRKDELYKTYKMKEINTYTPTEARKMALVGKHFGPWSDEERRRILGTKEVSMRIIDARNQPPAKIERVERQYPETHYRWVEHACPGPVTDLDIRQFRERMDKEGAVVIFISNHGLTAYIPIGTAVVPQTTPLSDDLLQYYKVPRDAF